MVVVVVRICSTKMAYDSQSEHFNDKKHTNTTRFKNLVWYGGDLANHGAKNFMVCDYLGEKANHLCWSEFSFTNLNQERARNRVFDNTYMAVGRDYGAIGDMGFPNPHEFNMLDGGETFLQAIYEMKRMDLTPYAGRRDGYILDGCFQEVDVVTGRQLFRWCALEHLPITETLLYLNIPENKENYSEPIGGQGLPTIPWDWFHFNSVDKNEEGDYLISGRHLDQVLKIAGKSNPHGLRGGSIIWRLNGKSNDFEMLDNFTFSRQHHVRFVKTEASETTIALFNNGWEVRNRDGFANHASSGQIITVNNETMQARLVHEYIHPDEGLTIAQGSMHVTPNENAIVGWGTLPQLSEYSPDGTLIFHAHFSEAKARNYRAWKFPFVGKPTWPPKLLAYSLTCSNSGPDSPLMAYVSWNGATEVAAWRFYVSTTSQTGPWLPAGTFPKTGFETKANLTGSVFGGFSAFAPFVSVEALNENGVVLGSVSTDTFVPSPAYEDACDAEGCGGEGSYFKYRPDQSCASSTCGVNLIPAVIVFILVVIGIESLVYLADGWWDRAVGLGAVGRRLVMTQLADMEEKNVEFVAGVAMGQSGPEGRPMLFGKRSKSGYEKPGKVHELLSASGYEV